KEPAIFCCLLSMRSSCSAWLLSKEMKKSSTKAKTRPVPPRGVQAGCAPTRAERCTVACGCYSYLWQLRLEYLQVGSQLVDLRPAARILGFEAGDLFLWRHAPMLTKQC